MKKFSKILSVALLVALVLSLGVANAFAQSVAYSGTDGDGATITINNAAKGETYKVVKLFDATVTNPASDAIAYQGTVPTALAGIFEADSQGNVSLKHIADENGKNPGEEGYVETFYEITADDFATMKTWADGQTATASAESDGSVLTFTGLPYGYYVITSTQGATVTVDSTNPNADVYDKNSKTITVDKKVDKESYSVGDTITYTATFDTVNWLGEGKNAKQVIEYTIADTLPEFLSSVNVKEIYVDADGNLTDTTSDQTSLTVQQFNNEKKIVIPWATEVADSNPKAYTSLYPNGAKLVITYTAVLTDVTNINTADTNTVSIHPTTFKDDTEEHPWDDSWQDDAVIKTYAAALKKTDGTNPLKGAQFTIKGLTVKPGDAAGEYIVVSYNSAADAAESAVLDTNDDGKLYIIGLASDVDLVVTEYKAPDGYNKLTAPVTVEPQLMTEKIYTASGTIKYDAKGNVIASEATATTTETVTKNLTDLDEKAVEVVNNAGTQLPSTGGIGTTIFYVVGGVLVLAAIILLVTKKRMSE